MPCQLVCNCTRSIKIYNLYLIGITHRELLQNILEKKSTSWQASARYFTPKPIYIWPNPLPIFADPLYGFRPGTKIEPIVPVNKRAFPLQDATEKLRLSVHSLLFRNRAEPEFKWRHKIDSHEITESVATSIEICLQWRTRSVTQENQTNGHCCPCSKWNSCHAMTSHKLHIHYIMSGLKQRSSLGWTYKNESPFRF